MEHSALTRLMGELTLAIRQRTDESERLAAAAEDMPSSAIQAAQEEALRNEGNINELQETLDMKMKLQMVEYYRLQADEYANEADETVEVVKNALINARSQWDSTQAEITEDYHERMVAYRDTYAVLQSRKRALIAQLQMRKALIERLERDQIATPDVARSI